MGLRIHQFVSLNVVLHHFVSYVCNQAKLRRNFTKLALRLKLYNFVGVHYFFNILFSNSAKLAHSLLFSFAIMLVKIEIETTETERS